MPKRRAFQRVTAFTIAMARHRGLSDDQVRVIARGAFLHDIGKMAIPDTILRKPGPLTAEEVSIMREHCYHGYQMLRRSLSGRSFGYRLFSPGKMGWLRLPTWSAWKRYSPGRAHLLVADTLDAITSDRPYRPKQTLQAAKEEIQRFAGRQFDPNVVETFLAMPDHIWDDLRREIDNQIHKFGYSSTATLGK